MCQPADNTNWRRLRSPPWAFHDEVPLAMIRGGTSKGEGSQVNRWTPGVLLLAVLLASVFVTSPVLAIKVYLGPSTQLSNYSPDGLYVEGNAMQIVAQKLYDKLAARGIQVKNGAWQAYGTSDWEALNWEGGPADAVFAIHTNACCASGTGWHPSHGTQMFPYSGSTDYAASYDMASRVGNKMIAKFGAFGIPTSLGIYSDTYSQFPSNPQACNVLLETLFHDNWNDCVLVLQLDSGKDAYAQAVFEGLCDHYGWVYTANKEIIVDPRGQYSQYYQDDADANWGNSAGSCNGFDSGLSASGTRYYPVNPSTPTGRWIQIAPALRVPGGTYQVDAAHFSNVNISADITVSTSLAGATALNGDLTRGTTNAFRQGQGSTWVKVGDIRLTAGQTQPTIRFTYSSGNVNDSAHRWNVAGFRFSLIPTASTLTLNAPTGGTVAGGGAKTAGDSVTATATASPGYRFLSWTTGGFNGTVVSTSRSYAFAMPGQNYTLYANFLRSGTALIASPCPPEGGTTTGSDGYTPGQSVTITATANPGYTWTNWTSGSCGGTVVETSPSYTFTMPSVDTTFYANFAVNSYTLTAVGSPAPGGVVTGSGTKTFGASCTVSQTPNPGFRFLGWEDSSGAVLSTAKSYTFTMPASNYTVYASYAAVVFYDGFETYNNACIDMNYTGSPNNFGTNGDRNGNPWFGADPRDAMVDAGVGVHLGSKALSATTGTAPYNCENAVNLAYRFNDGNPYTGNVYLEWYFYDPKGATGGDQFRDFAGLSQYKTSPVWSATTDYDFAAGYNATLRDYLNQFLAIGGSWDVSAGYDSSKYQIRVMGAPGSYANGWFNSSVTRSVGWHHALITLGSAKVGGTNDASFYIDGALVATKDTVTSGGVNSLSVYTRPSGFVSGAVDDISFGALGTQMVQKWSVIGPYAFTGNDINPGHLAPDYLAPSGTNESNMCASTGKSYNGRSWGLCDGGIVDLGKVLGSPTYCAAYMFTYVVNSGPAITDGDITMGSDDGIKVFWNGAAIWSNDTYRGLTVDSDHYGPITINPGVNRLMVKITQGVGGFMGQLRLTRADGTPLPNVILVPSDDAAPTGSITVNNGATGTASRNVTLSLSATDDLSGLNTMKFSNDNVSWSNAEPFAATKLWTLSAGAGLKTVYVSITDKAGNSRTYSAPVTYVIPTALSRLSDLWSQPNGGAFVLSNKPVTASAGGAFWIEETDRSAGLKVLWPNAISQGHAVNVYGFLQLSGLQRAMAASSVEDIGDSPWAITPVGMVRRTIGGVGLYNIGMLVRIAGSVTYSNTDNPAAKYFVVDDGSGLTDGNGHMGLKVICGSATPPTSGTVRVTGVIDTETVSGKAVPVLVVRDAAEVNAP